MIRENWTMKYGMKERLQLHRFELDGLKPGTKYTYEICYLNQNTAETVSAHKGSFTTHPADGMDHKFVLLSDTQVTADVRKKVMAEMMKYSDDALFAVHLGDFVNSLDDDVHEVFFDHVLNAVNGLPFVPVRGNHEYRGDYTGAYGKYFGSPYFSFRVGDVFYIVLDTGEDKAPDISPKHYTLRTYTDDYFREQGEWLKKVIQTEECKTAKRRIVLAHCTPFESNSKFFVSRLNILTAGVFWGENPACKIDLWLCGHTHHAYRFDPILKEFWGVSQRRMPNAWDRENIHFPVYVNDGPGGGGADISALEIKNDPAGITIIYHSLHGKQENDEVRIEPGKPIIVRKTTFHKAND